MERIEEFSREGKNFVYIDLSGITSDAGFLEVTKAAESAIAKYPEHSVYTITNIADVRFDSRTKEIAAKYTANNEPYVKSGVVIGLDGIKKMLVDAVLRLSGRKNLTFAFTKNGAIEIILKSQQ